MMPLYCVSFYDVKDTNTFNKTNKIYLPYQLLGEILILF